MTLETKYDVGDTVLLRHDSDKVKRMVTGFSFNGSAVSYCLANGDNEGWHLEFEIVKDNGESKHHVAGFKK